MARLLLLLVPLLLAGAVGWWFGQRQSAFLRDRLSSALPIVRTARALATDDAIGEPAQHRLHQLEALEGWDRRELE